jgi:hypothetical protein
MSAQYPTPAQTVSPNGKPLQASRPAAHAMAPTVAILARTFPSDPDATT